MRDLRRIIPLVAVVMLGTGVVRGQDRIVVGSKNFTENRLLAEIVAQLLEDETDLEVVRRINLGGTMVVAKALESGAIDIYPEYTGTAWAIHLDIEARVVDPLRVYHHVAQVYERDKGITWLTPFGFSNSFAIAVSEKQARQLSLVRISDLIPHAAGLRAGVSHEFLEREDGYPGLARAYGLELDVRGMDHGLAYKAIASGDIDVIDTWTTDGKLGEYDIRILEDDRRFFPPYDCVPIVRNETLARHPEVATVLDQVGFRISNELMTHLNSLVEVEEQSFEDVARGFIKRIDLESPWWERGEDDAAVDVGESKRGQGLLSFLADRTGVILELTLEHVALTLAAVLAAVLVAIPVGIVLTRSERLAGVVLGGAGVVQTVPSLALLAFFIPVLGLGIPAALAALFLYALLPIVRNTYTGIREIDPDLIEAARGMGLTVGQTLRIVELPLATRTIMAGVRTATVISIGIATLAAFIGAGGLGDPIVTGIQLDSTNEVLSGAIPAALLAIVIDWLLARLEGRLIGRGRAAAAAA